MANVGYRVRGAMRPYRWREQDEWRRKQAAKKQEAESMADLRMPELNVVVLAGRLSKDPELRYTQSGKAVTSFGLACGRRYKVGSETREDVYWATVQCWDKLAEYVGERLRKGAPVIIEGRLTTDEWEQKDGTKRQTTRIVASRVQQLAWDSDKADNGQQASDRTGSKPAGKPEPTHADEAETEDDIPF